MRDDRDHRDEAWHDLLREAAEADDATSFDVADDVARGRRKVRRTRVLVTGVGVLAGGVVAGTALVAGGLSGGADTAPPAGTPTRAPTSHEPVTTVGPSPSPSPSAGATRVATPPSARDRQVARVAKVMNAFDGLGPLPYPGWRNALFRTAQSVLDPSGTRLDYATRSLQGGSAGKGAVSIGIKLGWRVPGSPGEGMVQVQVASGGGPAAACGSMGEVCTEVVRRDGRTFATTPGSGPRFVVSHTQPDGDVVTVLVDPLFGNDSTVGVGSTGITRADVMGLVQDDRIDLPGA